MNKTEMVEIYDVQMGGVSFIDAWLNVGGWYAKNENGDLFTSENNASLFEDAVFIYDRDDEDSADDLENFAWGDFENLRDIPAEFEIA